MGHPAYSKALPKYSWEPFGSAFMVAAPGVQLAGHTSPCSSVNWNAFTSRRVSLAKGLVTQEGVGALGEEGRAGEGRDFECDEDHRHTCLSTLRPTGRSLIIMLRSLPAPSMMNRPLQCNSKYHYKKPESVNREQNG